MTDPIPALDLEPIKKSAASWDYSPLCRGHVAALIAEIDRLRALVPSSQLDTPTEEARYTFPDHIDRHGKGHYVNVPKAGTDGTREDAPKPELRAVIESLDGHVGIMEEHLENEKFCRALKGGADDNDTPMPFVRVFECEVVYLRARVTMLQQALTANSPRWMALSLMPAERPEFIIGAWKIPDSDEYEVGELSREGDTDWSDVGDRRCVRGRLPRMGGQIHRQASEGRRSLTYRGPTRRRRSASSERRLSALTGLRSRVDDV